MNNAEDITIALCDDHAGVMLGLALLIQQECPLIRVVGTATEASEAIAILQSESPQVFLVDLYMPNTDGLELTRDIKRLSPSTCVIVLTMSDAVSDLRRSLIAGASGFVSKASGPFEICAAIRAVASGLLSFPSFIQGVSAELYLNERESAILRAVAGGHTDEQIARATNLSVRTVRRTLAILKQRYGLRSRIQMALFAVEHGLTKPGSQ